MAIFLPTEPNIHALKSILMKDFGLKSAHASEGIAALLGFGSYAAFLRLFCSSSEQPVFDVDFDNFERRTTHLGYDANSSEYLRLRYAKISWPEPIWRIFKRRDQYLKNKWFEECKSRNLPFLRISKATKYFTFEWDHMSTDSKYDGLVERSLGGDLVQTMFKNYQMITHGVDPKSYFCGSALVGEVTGLSELSARQIANVFAKLLVPGNLKSAERA